MSNRLVYSNEERQACINACMKSGNDGMMFLGREGIVGCASGDLYILALTKFNGKHDGQHILIDENGSMWVDQHGVAVNKKAYDYRINNERM